MAKKKKLVGREAFKHEKFTELLVFKDKISDELNCEPGQMPEPVLKAGQFPGLVTLHEVSQVWRNQIHKFVPTVKATVLVDVLVEYYVTKVYVRTGYQSGCDLLINCKAEKYEGYLRRVYADIYHAKSIELLFEEANIDPKYIRPVVYVIRCKKERFATYDYPTVDYKLRSVKPY